MGLIKDDEKLTDSIIGKLERSKNPTTARRARLAETLGKMHG